MLITRNLNGAKAGASYSLPTGCSTVVCRGLTVFDVTFSRRNCRIAHMSSWCSIRLLQCAVDTLRTSTMASSQNNRRIYFWYDRKSSITKFGRPEELIDNCLWMVWNWVTCVIQQSIEQISVFMNHTCVLQPCVDRRIRCVWLQIITRRVYNSYSLPGNI